MRDKYVRRMQILQWMCFSMAVVFAVWILSNPFPARGGLPQWTTLIGPGIGMVAMAWNGLSCRRKVKLLKTWARM